MKDYKLSSQELRELRAAHRQTKQKKVADKLKAVYLLGKGWSVLEVCEALLLDETTITRYYNRYTENGLRGLVKNYYQGSSCELTETELDLLDEYLQELPCRTTKEVRAYVCEEFEVEYSVSGMTALLKRLDYVYKKPQVVPGKAEKVAQRSFVKEYRALRKKMAAKDSVFFMDGVHPQHNPVAQCGWFKKGVQQPLKTNTRYHRLHINGAVDIDTLDVITIQGNRLDEELSLDFLEVLRKKRDDGIIYLILDNAGYYTGERFRTYAKGLGIELVYLPPYSPNLNLIERLWRHMQRHILGRYYEKFEEFKTACAAYFKSLRYRKDELRSLLTENFEILGV